MSTPICPFILGKICEECDHPCESYLDWEEWDEWPDQIDTNDESEWTE